MDLVLTMDQSLGRWMRLHTSVRKRFNSQMAKSRTLLLSILGTLFVGGFSTPVGSRSRLALGTMVVFGGKEGTVFHTFPATALKTRDSDCSGVVLLDLRSGLAGAAVAAEARRGLDPGLTEERLRSIAAGDTRGVSLNRPVTDIDAMPRISIARAFCP
jgi:hypothetical protein